MPLQVVDGCVRTDYEAELSYAPLFGYEQRDGGVMITSPGTAEAASVSDTVCIGTSDVPVIGIAAGAFEGLNGLTGFTMNKTAGYELGTKAFFGTGIEGAVLIQSEGMSYGPGAFADCQGLAGFVSSDSRSPVYQEVLYGNGGSGLVLLQYPAGNDRTNFTAYPGCVSIEAYAFYGAQNLQKVILSADTVSVGAEAFVGCTGLKEIWIPAGTTDIDPTAFGDLVFMDGETVLDTDSLAGHRYVLQDGVMQRMHRDAAPATVTFVDRNSGNILGFVTGNPSDSLVFEPLDETVKVPLGWTDALGNEVSVPGYIPDEDSVLYAVYDEPAGNGSAVPYIAAIVCLTAAAAAILIHRRA